MMRSLFALWFLTVASSAFASEETLPNMLAVFSARQDLVVRAKVTFDPKQFYQIIAPADKKIGPQYYLCGKLTVTSFLFASSVSQFEESLRLSLDKVGREMDVLIPAQRISYDYRWVGPGRPPNELCFQPTIQEGRTWDSSDRIYLVSVVYIFPVGGLVIDYVIPRTGEKEVLEIIKARPHNLVK